MKDTFTLADLANFKLEPPKAEPPPVVPEAVESSAAATEMSDETVETSAETTPAPTVETTESEPEAETPEQPGKFIPKARFDEVIDERNQLRRFNEYLLAKEQVIPTVATTAVPSAAEMPTLENNGFDVPKYEEAMKAWTKAQVEAAKNQGAEQATEATTRNAFNDRMAAYAKANPSVVKALGNPNLPQLAKEAAAVVVESELGPQILHHLGTNPDLAAKIAKKTPAQQAADVGRIEGELRAKKSPQKTPQITRAPNPPTPTAGRGNTPSVDPLKMSTKEWIAWDRQQTMEKRRAAKAARH